MKKIFCENKRAEKLMGKRNLPDNAVPFDQPCELGYHCPVCKYSEINNQNREWDERLQWSEYNGFIWCFVCNKDYPSCLCYNIQSKIPDYIYKAYPDCKTYIDLSIKTFLDTVEGVKKMKGKILNIRLKDGQLEIAEKVGKTSYDVLHVGILNDSCFLRMRKLLGGTEKEFIIKPMRGKK